MTSKIWRGALGAVKDQTSIGLAKVGSSNSLVDLDIAIVKATKHNEAPGDEKHVREILSLTSYSRSHVSACVSAISRRLSRTRSWTVALKSLVLIQRLIQEGDPAYETEIFFATRRGTRLLNMSDFRDTSRANSWDFSAFVRTYALYLDERLEYRMMNKRGRRSSFGYEDEFYARDNRDGHMLTYKDIDKDRERDKEEDKDRDKNRSESKGNYTPLHEKMTEALFSRMQHLQLLLERFLACRPTGKAKNHRIVMVALYPILKESFLIYSEMTEILDILIARFEDMQIQDCTKVYDIFCRVGKQYDELDLFYTWNKSTGIARSSEFPEIERITSKKLEIMDDFIRERTNMANSKRNEKPQEEEEIVEEPEPPQEDDMNAIKALPPPETIEEPIEEPKIEKEPKVVQTEGDLLHLGDDDIVKTSEDHENKLALALFDGAGPTTMATSEASSATLALPWHAFEDGSDWEKTLVESASKLSNQKPTLGGGFDTLLLDSMYNQVATNSAVQGYNYCAGSASSLVQNPAGKSPMLTLPASTVAASSGWVNNADPFAASVAVAPPAYVQMSEMEKKQRLMTEEQILWQQYARNNGMQGHVGMTRMMQPNNYMGGYQTNFYYH